MFGLLYCRPSNIRDSDAEHGFELITWYRYSYYLQTVITLINVTRCAIQKILNRPEMISDSNVPGRVDINLSLILDSVRVLLSAL